MRLRSVDWAYLPNNNIFNKQLVHLHLYIKILSMKDLRDLKEEDFSKINLHIHTTYSDGKAEFEDVVKNAKANGYELIAITDHNTVEGHKIFQDDILMTGVEFDCWCGYVFIHLLAYGIDVNSEFLKPFLAKNKAETEGDFIRLFSKRNVPKLIEEYIYYYNNERPSYSLKYKTPIQYKIELGF